MFLPYDSLPPDNASSQTFLRELYLTDPLENMNNLKRKKGGRSTGTCEWFALTKDFKRWLEHPPTEDSICESPNVLWLYGNPGTGKSTMAIYLVEHLTKLFAGVGDKGLVYFFCDMNSEKQSSAIGILRGILWQLAKQDPLILEYMWREFRTRTWQFESFDTLWSLFQGVATIPSIGTKYIIIDALDECNLDAQENLLRSIKELFTSSEQLNLRILITSRPYPEIRDWLEEFPNSDLSSFVESKRDVDSLIQAKVAELKRKKRYTAKIEQAVIKILEAKAEGTFLWVGLACAELEKVRSQEAIIFLERLPSGLNAIYQTLLDAVLLQSDMEQEDLRRILSFVAVAIRPLHLSELSVACQLHLDEDEPERLQFIREMVEACRLMVIIDKSPGSQHQTVHLLHKSVKDFLFQTGPNRWRPIFSVHADFAYRCLDYLMQTCRDELHDLRVKPTTDFLWYSTDSWVEHARLAESKFQITSTYMPFFLIVSPIRERWLSLYRMKHLYEIPRTYSILQVAAKWGILSIVDYVCNDYSTVINSTKPGLGTLAREKWTELRDHGTKALLTAAGSKYPAIFSHMLKVQVLAPTKTNGPDLQPSTTETHPVQIQQIPVTDKVLQVAARNVAYGKEMITILLNQRGHEITITQEVVKVAARNGPEVLKTLLALIENRKTLAITNEAVGILIEHCDHNMIKSLLHHGGNDIRKTILMWATSHAQWEMMNLLPEKGKNIDIYCKEAFVEAFKLPREYLMKLIQGYGAHVDLTDVELYFEAAQVGHKYMVELILDRSIDVNIGNGKALLEATQAGHEDMVRLLLDRGADISIGNGEPLSRAIQIGNKSIVELLLDRGADINVPNGEPLRMAIRVVNDAMVELLLNRGPTMGNGESLRATQTGNNDMVMLLLERGADINISNGELLCMAVRAANKDMVELLLSKGADINTRNGEPLCTAIGVVNKDMVELLLNRGADINIRNGEPLCTAVRAGYKDIVKLLLDRGADVNIRNGAPLCAAVRAASKYTVELMLNRGADINIRNGEALIAAITTGNESVVQSMLHGRHYDQYRLARDLLHRLVGNDQGDLSRHSLVLLETIGTLVSLLVAEGRWNEAGKHEVQSTESSKVLDIEDSGNSIKLGNMTYTYGSDGRWKEVEDLEMELMIASLQILGPDHLCTLNLKGNLACTYGSHGRWKEAEELEAEVLQTSLRLLGPEHPCTLTSQANLAATFANQSRWAEAEATGLHVSEIKTRVFGHQHESTLISLANVASVYASQGRWKDAEDLEVYVWETRKRLFGDEDLETLVSQANLACTYGDEGQWSKAEELELQVFDIRKRVLGPMHPKTLTSQANLASTYQNQGRWKEAEELGAQVMEMRNRILGPEHPDTLTGMANLGFVYMSQGRLNEAINLMESCAELSGKVFGSDHYLSKHWLSTLDAWHSSQED